MSRPFMRLQSLLMWENTLQSTVFLIFFSAAFWLLAQSYISAICLLAVVALCVILRDFSNSRSRIETEVYPATGGLQERCSTVEPGCADISELANCAADWLTSAMLYVQMASAMRRERPGLFCIIVSSVCLLMVALGRVLSGATVAYLLVLSTFTWPLVARHRLATRRSNFARPTLTKLKHTLPSERPRSSFGGSAATPKAAVYQHVDDSSSLLGSLMLDVSEMPSHEETAFDSFAVSAMMSPNSLSLVDSRWRRTDDYVDNDSCEGTVHGLSLASYRLSPVSQVNEYNTCWSASRDACRSAEETECELHDRHQEAAECDSTGKSAGVEMQGMYGSGFSLARLPHAVKTMAATALNTVSNLPVPTLAWAAASAPTVDVGVECSSDIDSDFEFLTKEDIPEEDVLDE